MIIGGQKIDELPQNFGYNADGTLAYAEVVIPAIQGSYVGGTYRQSYTYTSGKLTQISSWVRQ